MRCVDRGKVVNPQRLCSDVCHSHIDPQPDSRKQADQCLEAEPIESTSSEIGHSRLANSENMSCDFLCVHPDFIQNANPELVLYPVDGPSLRLHPRKKELWGYG